MALFIYKIHILKILVYHINYKQNFILNKK